MKKIVARTIFGSMCLGITGLLCYGMVSDIGWTGAVVGIAALVGIFVWAAQNL